MPMQPGVVIRQCRRDAESRCRQPIRVERVMLLNQRHQTVLYLLFFVRMIVIEQNAAPYTGRLNF